MSYFLGQRSGWDYGVVGFWFVTKANLKELGLDLTENEILAYLTSDFIYFNKWLNGEVYEYRLYNSEGEFVDGCGGFYSIEDIRRCLPDEYKDEDLEEYLI